MPVVDMRNQASSSNNLGTNESFGDLYIIIVTLVHLIFSDTIGPVDKDDVAQEVSIKVWNYWRTHPISHPRAFVRRIVYTVISDMRRHFKPSLFQEWPRDESGEINEFALPAQHLLQQEDPEWIVIQEESYDEILNQLADAVAALYKRQQNAMICTLKARMDEWSRLAAALEARGISTDLEWPDNGVEKQRLKASFSPARDNIAQHIRE